VRRRVFARIFLSTATVVAIFAGSIVLAGGSATAVPLPDQLVVSQVGTAGSTISDDPSPVSLVTVESDGSASGKATVALPIADSGANKALTLSGTSDAQGSLSRSADGSGLVIGGFDTAPTPGLGDPKGTAASVVPRVIGWVGNKGTADTSTVVTGGFDGDNIRSAVSPDGSAFYVTGKDTATGIYREALGSTAPTVITTKDKNFRTLGIYGGQLYASSDKSAVAGVSAIGTGLPTTGVAKLAAGNTPISTNSVQVGGAVGTPDGFVLLDRDNDGTPDTAYVVVETVGIYKYALTGGAWVAEGSIPGDFESLTGKVVGSSAVLYTLSHTTDAAPDANALLQLTDTATSIATVTAAAATTVATAPAGTAWRGVSFAPTGWAPVSSGGGSGPSGDTPTVTPAQIGLPLAIGDPTNPTLGVTVGDVADGPDDLTVAVTASSTPAVAGIGDAVVSGSGADRVLTVTPRAVGTTSLTLTVTDPATGKAGTATVSVGVSGNPTALDTPRYHDGAADGSTVIDVGGGYMLVADDEDTVIRLYQENSSGFPTASWDFASDFPAGELDLEAAVRVGNTIYWSGSMSNSKSAVYEASRNVFFSTTISGSGAATQLTFVGSYSGLRDELMAWDHANSDRLGLDAACSTTTPTLPDVTTGCNLEGLEFAPGSSTTALLGFRSPVIAGKALVVPVTNYSSLIGAAAGSAQFGDPIMLDLGGRSIREIRQNANGQYLITAGVPDDGNQGLGWALYRWNGQAASQPVLVADLPSESGAAGQEAGSWESIVNVPAALTPGTRVQLLTDNGTTVFYGGSVAGKDVTPLALQKSISSWVTLGSIADNAATVSKSNIVAGGTVTVSAGGFTAGESVDVTLHSVPVHLATIVAGSNGVATAIVTIPASTTAGAHTLVLTGARSGVVATAAIVVAADPGAGLAFTGADPSIPLTIALGLLVLGLAASVLRRRTRRATI
jgi:hypothetical protein